MNQNNNTANAQVAGLTAAQNSIGASGELLLYGVIGDWWDDLDVATIVNQLEQAAGDEIVIRIHSKGGNVLDGLAIYNRLKSSNKRVVVYNDGMALSIAGVIMCAGDEVIMPDNALFMMHKPWNFIEGNADELREAADGLDMLQRSLVPIYMGKSGLDEETVNQMLEGSGTWLNGVEAKEHGFADTVIDSIQAAASVDLSNLSAPADKLAALFKPADSSANSEEVPVETAQANAAGNPAAENEAITQAVAQERQRVREIRAIGTQVNASDEVLNGWLESDSNVDEVQAQALVYAQEQSQGSGQSPEADPALAQAAAAAVAAERQRTRDIREIATQAAVTDDQLNTWLESESEIGEIRAQALSLVAAQDASGVQRHHVRVEAGNAAARAAVENALAHRANPTRNQLDPSAHDFAGRPLMEVARAYLASTGHASAYALTQLQLAQAAFQSSSDFPLILADVMNNNLRAAYTAAPRTFAPLGIRATVNDFRMKYLSQLGEGTNLSKVNENGEFKHGKMSETRESYKVDTYGVIFTFTRQMLIDDDLSAFTRFTSQAGGKAAQLESSIVWGLIEANAAMADGNNIFSAEHSNLIAGGAGITVARLNVGRKQMRKQTGLDDGEPLNLTPAFLVVSAERETEAQQIITSITPNAAGDVNPFQNSMQIIVEPRLADAPWYLWADPSMVDTFEYAYLSGNEGVYTETEVGFEVDGMKLKVRHDFGAGMIDHRGVQKNNGV
ncbi:MAG: ATP-dependent Clp protease proteolytic subunit [Pseudomonadaceae bacterium]|nr:ATP-dependent Clp protease proteolytic subunit [Pseudomonadaceae bacterium]